MNAVPDAATEIVRNLANATALTGRDARAIAEAAVKVAALGEIAELHALCDDRLWGVEKHAERMEAERDATLAVLERIRQAVAGHPKCDRYEEDDAISCGWKSAYASVVWALDGAPEPEWEYRATTDNGAFVGESRTTPEHAVQALQEAVDEYPIVIDEQGVKVERRPRSPWLPVEGSES